MYAIYLGEEIKAMERHRDILFTRGIKAYILLDHLAILIDIGYLVGKTLTKEMIVEFMVSK